VEEWGVGYSMEYQYFALLRFEIINATRRDCLDRWAVWGALKQSSHAVRVVEA
jgi:NADH:ubiquinone oxidoreductase subunit D